MSKLSEAMSLSRSGVPLPEPAKTIYAPPEREFKIRLGGGSEFKVSWPANLTETEHKTLCNCLDLTKELIALNIAPLKPLPPVKK